MDCGGHEVEWYLTLGKVEVAVAVFRVHLGWSSLAAGHAKQYKPVAHEESEKHGAPSCPGADSSPTVVAIRVSLVELWITHQFNSDTHLISL